MDNFLCRAKRMHTDDYIVGFFAQVGHGLSQSGSFEEYGDVKNVIFVTKNKQSSLYPNSNPCEIITTEMLEVDIKTISKCTGKKDKNNINIFENDEIRITLPIKNIEKPITFQGIVKYIESSFRICCSRNETPRLDDFTQDSVFEIVEHTKAKNIKVEIKKDELELF